jgi:hypothetical protein
LSIFGLFFFALAVIYFLKFYISKKTIHCLEKELLDFEKNTKKTIHCLEKELLDFEKNKKEVLTIDAKDLLSDLCRGSAVIKITPLDPKYIFEYSPRG